MKRALPYIGIALGTALMMAGLFYGCADTQGAADLQSKIDAFQVQARADSARAADNALAADAWRATAQEAQDQVADLLASLDVSQRLVREARAETDRLASTLSALRTDYTRALQASQDAPDSLPLAQQALTACSATLTGCEALTAQQGRQIAQQDTALAQSSRAIVALQRQATALDSTATRYESAYLGILQGYTSRGQALDLYDVQTVALRRTLRTTRRQRDLTRAALAGVVVGAAYLLGR